MCPLLEDDNWTLYEEYLKKNHSQILRPMRDTRQDNLANAITALMHKSAFLSARKAERLQTLSTRASQESNVPIDLVLIATLQENLH